MIYFSHRGDNVNYPENTLLSFDKAIMAGATAIEFDVHKTLDGELVVIHDEDIKRTYNGSGLIKDFTLARLKTFQPKDAEFKDNKLCKIPTLNEVLEILKHHDILINIELKTDEIQYENIEIDVIEAIKKHNTQEKVLISSFNHGSLEICKSIDSNLKLGVLFDKRIDNIVTYAKNLGAYSLHPNVQLVDRELLTSAHENNLKVFTYTVNSSTIACHLEKEGCDGIFTDNINKFINL